MSRSFNTRILMGTGLLLIFAAAGCQDKTDSLSADPTQTKTTTDHTTIDTTVAGQNTASGQSVPQVATEHDVKVFCGACHAVPMPESFPKHAWYDEVRRGFQFYYDSGRRDLKPPLQTSVVRYYQQLAPEKLDTPALSEAPLSPLTFRRIGLQLPTVATRESAPPAISFLATDDDWIRNRLIRLSDMRSGWIAQYPAPDNVAALNDHSELNSVTWSYADVAISPASVRIVQLTGDVADDLLVADLGSFLPEDHDHGKVVLIPNGTTSHPGQPVNLLDKIGRVADVQVADFNQDGLLDIAVAEFGWHVTGGVHLLLATEKYTGPASFEHVVLDKRSGAIHVIPVDINQDGRLDLLSLLSQEHEQIVAYLNGADGKFTASPVYSAPDPSWGSSGIAVHDMDQDGDMDIVYTNGDTFDSYIVKPFHGVHWIENQGDMTFQLHEIGALPGVHRALPADMDGDGDLDIVAAALLPEKTRVLMERDLQHGLIWFEQTTRNEFIRHVIERAEANYAAAIIIDVNGDQRPDIVTGSFLEREPSVRHDVRIFLNEKSP